MQLPSFGRAVLIELSLGLRLDPGGRRVVSGSRRGGFQAGNRLVTATAACSDFEPRRQVRPRALCLQGDLQFRRGASKKHASVVSICVSGNDQLIFSFARVCPCSVDDSDTRELLARVAISAP